MSSAITQNTWMITARLPRKLAVQLRQHAEKRNQRVTEIIVEAVEEKLNQENQPRTEHLLDAQAV